MQSRLTIKPCELGEANAFVAKVHRHHKPTVGHRWSYCVVDEEGQTRGVAIVGRPVARAIDQHSIVEVLRVATDGCDNACSALYGAACRQQKAHGYNKAITYTLASEPGISLRAAGWRPVLVSDGGSWIRDAPGRSKKDVAPTIAKIRWECMCSDLPAIELPEYTGPAWQGTISDPLETTLEELLA